MAERKQADVDVDVNDEGGADGEGGVRPFWSGVITFGLVSVPVELYVAVGQSRVALHLLSAEGHPLRRRYVSAADQQPLEREAIVRGWETDKGDFVTVSDEELAGLEPRRSREIDLRRFVPKESLDPLWSERAYFLLPDGEVTKPYRLLAETIEASGKAGIATFVMRGREVAVAITSDHGILRAETLRRADELRTPDAVGLPAPSEPEAALVKKLRAAIHAHAKPSLDTKALVDENAAAIRALAEKKRKKGKDLVEVPEDLVTTREDDASMAPIVDIVALIKERLGTAPAKGAKAAKPGRPAKTATPRRRAARA